MKTETYEQIIELLIKKVEDDQLMLGCKDYRIKDLEAQVREFEEKAKLNEIQAAVKKIEKRKEV